MTCPICQKPAHTTYRPFCCERCADVDLGKWLTGRYAFASERDDDDGAAASAIAERAEITH